MELGDAESFQDMCGKFSRTTDEFLNTDERGEQFGRAGVYDNAKMNLANAARSLPGSRGKGNDRESKNLTGRSRFSQQERGTGRQRNARNANQTNGANPDWGADNHQRQEGHGEYQGDCGNSHRDVFFAWRENDSPIDLDW